MTDDPITAYGQAWQAVDEDERRALLEVAWAPDAVYCDPLDRLEGREALVRHIGATQAAMAGGQIAVTSTPVRHHDSAFFRWTMRDAVTWAYHRPEHAATVARQEEHALLPTSGFLRCAVVGSSGTLHGTDPLAGRTGAPVVLEETA